MGSPPLDSVAYSSAALLHLRLKQNRSEPRLPAHSHNELGPGALVPPPLRGRVRIGLDRPPGLSDSQPSHPLHAVHLVSVSAPRRRPAWGVRMARNKGGNPCSCAGSSGLAVSC